MPPRRARDRVTLADFERTGSQDCANVIDAVDFLEQHRETPQLSARQLVDTVWSRYEADGLEAEWLAQREDDLDGLDPAQAYARWRDGWKGCAVGYVERWLRERRGNPGRGTRTQGAKAIARVPTRANPHPRRFVVVRVGQDDRRVAAADYRGRDLDGAIALAIAAAQPRRGQVLDYATVMAADAAAALQVRPARWTRLNIDHQRNPAMADYIIEGMARTLWVTAYADWVQGLPAAMRRDLAPGQGGDWDDAAPTTPSSAEDAARSLAERYELQNELTLEQLATAAATADCRRQLTAKERDLFGHYLAMMSLGTGVSWFDDHKRFPLQVPRIECHTDGDEVDWSPRITRNPAKPKGTKWPSETKPTPVTTAGGYRFTLRPAILEITYDRSAHGHGGGVATVKPAKRADYCWLVVSQSGQWLGALTYSDQDEAFYYQQARDPHGGTRATIELRSSSRASGPDWPTVLQEGT